MTIPQNSGELGRQAVRREQHLAAHGRTDAKFAKKPS